jgi:hypothetical protein
VDLFHRKRAEALAAKVRQLPGYPDFPGAAAGQARYDHIGALIADAALQAAIDFNSVVRPRVQRLLAAWPEADTVDLFLVRVAAEGLHEVLDWKDAEKPARALRLANLLATEGVQTRVSDVIVGDWLADRLRVLRGSRGLVAAVLAHPWLEAWPVAEGDSLAWDADTINSGQRP